MMVQDAPFSNDKTKLSVYEHNNNNIYYKTEEDRCFEQSWQSPPSLTTWPPTSNLLTLTTTTSSWTPKSIFFVVEISRPGRVLRPAKLLLSHPLSHPSCHLVLASIIASFVPSGLRQAVPKTRSGCSPTAQFRAIPVTLFRANPLSASIHRVVVPL
mmetsp:Transcript_21641/g.53669  ORF Transcript_21641/g.53669 Transcript_21641/m.53669 type:complete len:156 (+) Transcript_21641:153-620(+)